MKSFILVILNVQIVVNLNDYHCVCGPEYEAEYLSEYSEQLALQTKETEDIINFIDDLKKRVQTLNETLGKKISYDCNKQLPENCYEAFAADGPRTGEFKIKLKHFTRKAFYVICNMEFGSSWLSILRRFDGNQDFNKDWIDYELGFGNFKREFWIGLEKLHEITLSEAHELLIIGTKFDGKVLTAYYDEFFVDDAEKMYNLTRLGVYSGNMGDFMTFFLGRKFTTRNKNNDESKGGDNKPCNDNKPHDGGWWHNSCSYPLTLTQTYGTNPPQRGIGWNQKIWNKESFERVEMWVRPRKRHINETVIYSTFL